MADKFTQDELIKGAKSPGWELVTGADEKPVSGTLEDLAKAAHERRQSGSSIGIIRRIENAVELEMIQIEELWQHLGLPM